MDLANAKAARGNTDEYRERVLDMWAARMSGPAIADALGISNHRVDYIVKSACLNGDERALAPRVGSRPKFRLRQCLGVSYAGPYPKRCEKMVKSEGPHHRLCSDCRWRS